MSNSINISQEDISRSFQNEMVRNVFIEVHDAAGCSDDSPAPFLVLRLTDTLVKALEVRANALLLAYDSLMDNGMSINPGSSESELSIKLMAPKEMACWGACSDSAGSSAGMELFIDDQRAVRLSFLHEAVEFKSTGIEVCMLKNMGHSPEMSFFARPGYESWLAEDIEDCLAGEQALMPELIEPLRKALAAISVADGEQDIPGIPTQVS